MNNLEKTGDTYVQGTFINSRTYLETFRDIKGHLERLKSI